MITDQGLYTTDGQVGDAGVSVSDAQVFAAMHELGVTVTVVVVVSWPQSQRGDSVTMSSTSSLALV